MSTLISLPTELVEDLLDIGAQQGVPMDMILDDRLIAAIHKLIAYYNHVEMGHAEPGRADQMEETLARVLGESVDAKPVTVLGDNILPPKNGFLTFEDLKKQVPNDPLVLRAIELNDEDKQAALAAVYANIARDFWGTTKATAMWDSYVALRYGATDG